MSLEKINPITAVDTVDSLNVDICKIHTLTGARQKFANLQKTDPDSI